MARLICRLIPLGMSGLKSSFVRKVSVTLPRSHPAWDEWIEIRLQQVLVWHLQSHPAWDEWIEICHNVLRIIGDEVSSRLG